MRILAFAAAVVASWFLLRGWERSRWPRLAEQLGGAVRWAGRGLAVMVGLVVMAAMARGCDGEATPRGPDGPCAPQAAAGTAGPDVSPAPVGTPDSPDGDCRLPGVLVPGTGVPAGTVPRGR